MRLCCVLSLLLCFAVLHISALQYSLQHTSSDAVLEFSVHNPTDQPIYVLKRLTPLEGIMSDCLTVRTSYGEALPYDGLRLMRVEEPTASEFMLLGPQSTFTKQIDVSKGYSTLKHKAGSYEVEVNSAITHWPIPSDSSHLRDVTTRLRSSSAVVERATASIRVTTHSDSPIPTTDSEFGVMPSNAQARDTRSASNRPALSINPTFVGFTSAQRAEILRAHRAAAVFLWSSIQLLMYYSTNVGANTQFINYFGAINVTRYQSVYSSYSTMYSAITTRQFTYSDQVEDNCDGNTIAYTYGSTKGKPIFLCPLFFDDQIIPFSTTGQNRFATIIHEASHCWLNSIDTEYGLRAAKTLAQTDPAKTIISANSLGYFAAMSYPLDWAIDTIATTPSGTFATLGPLFFKFTNDLTGIVSGYPKAINGYWGILPASFEESFDSMHTINQKTYVTKGGQFIRYSLGLDAVDAGFPVTIQGNWGNTSSTFNEGFDAMATLHNRKLYIVKGNQYIRSSDGGATIDAGYPKALSEWKLPFSKFDAIFPSTVGGNRTFVMSGSQFSRCSDSECSVIDPGYPRSLRGSWGKMPYYQ